MSLLEITFNLSDISTFSVIVSIVGYCTVFFALVLLFLIFNNIPRFLNLKIRQSLRREGKTRDAKEFHIAGEVNAAVSLALFLYLNELHDDESHVITIKGVSKKYSPWSSKIYGLNTYSR